MLSEQPTNIRCCTHLWLTVLNPCFFHNAKMREPNARTCCFIDQLPVAIIVLYRLVITLQILGTASPQPWPKVSPEVQYIIEDRKDSPHFGLKLLWYPESCLTSTCWQVNDQKDLIEVLGKFQGGKRPKWVTSLEFHSSLEVEFFHYSSGVSDRGWITHTCLLAYLKAIHY